MPYLVPLSLVHLAALAWLSRATSRRLFAAPLPALFAGVVLAWVNLVLTALAASPFRLLGSPPAYFAISLALAVAAHRFFRRTCPVIAISNEPTWREIAGQVRGSAVTLVLAALLVVVVAGVLLVALAVLPNNWDTLAYRFPKALFFLSEGALAHAGPSLDPRLLYYPYNGSLLYLFLAQYQWPPMSWNLVAVGAWLLAGAGGFQLALAARGSARAGLVSAYAVLTTPIVLCLANSSNDELLASAPLVLALAFAAAWYRGRSPQALYLTALALGLALGVKLHWISLVPYFVFGAIWLLRRDGRRLVASLRASARPAPAVLVALVAALLAGGFVVSNLLATKHAFHPGYSIELPNRPFRVDVAWQTLSVHSAQMLLSPLPDHVRVLGVERGRRAYEWANRRAMEGIFRDVRQGLPFTASFARIRGLVDPWAEAFYEQSLWLGFVPHAALVALAWLLWRRPGNPELAIFLLAALPFWHVTFSSLYRYMESPSTYYAYPAALFAAGLGPAWQWARDSGRRADRWFAALVGVVLASNSLLAATVLTSNQRRNVRQAFVAGDGETPTTQAAPLVRAVVSEARRVEIPYTHWELLYWNLMRLNPAASYSTGRVDDGADLVVYSLSRRADDNYGVPTLPVRWRAGGPARYVGRVSSGDDLVYCTGETCERVCASCERHLLVPMTVRQKGKAVERSLGGRPMIGGAPPGELWLRVRWSADGVDASTVWTSMPELATHELPLPDAAGGAFRIELADSPEGLGTVEATEFRFEGAQLVLR